jgi:hypothetical protein
MTFAMADNDANSTTAMAGIDTTDAELQFAMLQLMAL